MKSDEVDGQKGKQARAPAAAVACLSMASNEIRVDVRHEEVRFEGV